ncbi:hypothetical protein [Lactobacillus sp. ESL0228]|uniref:hypothetical protein n=1 Tax=Lactobacillus sp. ESL0228 TaxID=2069352 RepID=UPI000EFCE37A|nr:hypothetical protein [Lactobacillus sp. ESL0228]RMC48895.1 hypothetical protein F5ESL0228_04665 [Lactobacillus sp. ESL0228]
MDLSKIYVGDKLVQQIYRGKQAITQAYRGKELVYSRSQDPKYQYSLSTTVKYDDKAYWPEQAMADSHNDVYVVAKLYSSGNFCVYKISENGTLLSKLGYSQKPIIQIDNTDNLYTIYQNLNGLFFDKYNSQGAKIAIGSDASITKDYRFFLDENYLYIYTDSAIIKYDQNLQKLSSTKTVIGLTYITASDKLYFYAVAAKQVYRISKANPVNYQVIYTADYDLLAIKVNAWGRMAVLLSNGNIQILNQTAKAIGNINSSFGTADKMLIDNYENVYGVSYDSGTYFQKYDSKGKQKFNNQLWDGSNDTLYSICICSNKLDNIYFFYEGADNFLHMQKFIKA